jgi:hypothetical protein
MNDAESLVSVFFLIYLVLLACPKIVFVRKCVKYLRDEPVRFQQSPYVRIPLKPLPLHHGNRQ